MKEPLYEKTKEFYNKKMDELKRMTPPTCLTCKWHYEDDDLHICGNPSSLKGDPLTILIILHPCMRYGCFEDVEEEK